MAFTGGTTSQDWIVEFQDRGAVDGAPATLGVTVITAIVRRFKRRAMVGKDIPVSGFGADELFRPGKKGWEIDCDVLVLHSAGLSVTEGNYAQFEYTIGSNTERKYCGYVKSAEEGVDDDGETILSITVKGPADGAAIT